jgi:hypothetical protein
MSDLVLTAYIGDVTYPVAINHYFGNSYQLYIGKMYIGLLCGGLGFWELSSNKPIKLTSDDIQILGELIEEKWGETNDTPLFRPHGPVR